MKRSKRKTLVATAGVLICGCALLSGCGGSSSSAGTAGAATSSGLDAGLTPGSGAGDAASSGINAASAGTTSGTPAARSRAAGGSRASTATRSGEVGGGSGHHRTGTGAAHSTPNEGSRGSLISLIQSNPCAYVTAAQAESILHSSSVTESEAPLGPTCIITAKGAKQVSTLALEVIEVAREVREMKDPSRLSLAGRSAYCGTLGRSMLLVPLTDHVSLDVSAPCPQAVELAAAALSRIKM